MPYDGDLARLSKCLQSSEGNMCSAMELVKTVIEDLEEYDFDKLQIEIAASRSKIRDAGAQLDDDLSEDKCLKICRDFVREILKNLRQRFSDEVSQLCDLQKIFKEKSDSPDLTKVANLLKVTVLSCKMNGNIFGVYLSIFHIKRN